MLRLLFVILVVITIFASLKSSDLTTDANGNANTNTNSNSNTNVGIHTNIDASDSDIPTQQQQTSPSSSSSSKHSIVVGLTGAFTFTAILGSLTSVLGTQLNIPTTAPTAVPTLVPTSAPTCIPTSAPTCSPTLAPSRLPSTLPTTLSLSLLDIGATYKISDNIYLKINSSTQLMRYKMSLSTTECKSLPYHIYNDSTLIIFGMDAFNLTKNPYTLLLENTKVNITKVTETFSLPECNPEAKFNFYDIASIFKQGDYFELSEDDYYFVERITSNKIVMSRIYANTEDVSCELDVLPGTISGPFLFSPNIMNLMAIGVIGNTYQFFYVKDGIIYNWNTITKLNDPPTHLKCPSFANNTNLEIKNIYNLNSAGKLLVSVVMNDTILGYYDNAFDNTVISIRYATGNITITNFNIKKRYSNDRYNAQPFFFNGTELFVLSKEGNFMQGYFFGEIHEFPTDLVFTNPKTVKYGKIGSNSYLFYPKFTDGVIDDIYSYNLKTKTMTALNVVQKVQNYFNEWTYLISEFIFMDNKLIWNYVANFNAFIYCDVTTASVGSFNLGTLSSINNDICFTCQGGFQLLLSSNNELMLFTLIGNQRNVAITFQPQVTNKLTSAYNINGDLYLQNALKGEIYQYKADSNLIVYEDILNGGAICSSYKFKQFDEKYVYTSDGKVTEISKCSNCVNDLYTFYFGVKILSSTAAVPTCIQKASINRYTISGTWTIESSDKYYISNGLLFEKGSSSFEKGVYIPFEEPFVIYLSQYEASSKQYVLVGNRKPIIYDMSIKKAINYVDIESQIDSLCGTTDWNIDNIVLSRNSTMACIKVEYTCYRDNGDNSYIQYFQIVIDGKYF